jgi:hypothetical protein
MAVKITNNACSTLANRVSRGSTTFEITDPASFPELGATDWMYLTLGSAAGTVLMETIRVTARDGAVCTCDPLQQDHPILTVVALRITIETIHDLSWPGQQALQEAAAVKAELSRLKDARIGTPFLSAGDTEPDALRCDGSEYLRVDYPRLYTQHGPAGSNLFGPGNGVDTFNICDARGYFLRITDGGAGRDPDAAQRTALFIGGVDGDQPGSVQSDQNLRHTHKMGKYSLEKDGARDPDGYPLSDTSNIKTADLTKWKTDAFSQEGGAEARPKNLGFNLFMWYQ